MTAFSKEFENFNLQMDEHNANCISFSLALSVVFYHMCC